jgi:hypothetical protein
MEKTQFSEDVERLLHGIKTVDANNRVYSEMQKKEIQKLQERNKELENILDHYRTILKNNK